MATVTPFIRTSKNNAKKVNIRFRLTINSKKSFYHSSEIEVNPNYWDSKLHKIKTKVVYKEDERNKFDIEVSDRRRLILDIYNNTLDKENFNSKQLDVEIDKFLYPELYQDEVKEKTIFDLFDEFLSTHPISEARKRHYKVVKRALQRFEMYQQKETKDYKLTIETITLKTLHDLQTFLKTEPEIYLKYPEIFKAVPESRTPQQKGHNTIRGFYTKLKTFYKWNSPKVTPNPFDKFEMKGEMYGTPYYITIDERNQLLSFDLSDKPHLEKQRDIFIFQCFTGCRVGDLYSLKTTSINGNFINYIARKTKDKKPITVKVPLHNKAVEILAKYEHLNQDEKILPFISEPKYNDAIKQCFELANINRIVTILDPTTGNTIQKPLYEVASSHLARRTFIGNLYKKVKDPNLIGSMTGHVEGSKAFARYRDIDDEDKIELIKMLD